MCKELDYRAILAAVAVVALLGTVTPVWAQAPVAGRAAESAPEPTSATGGQPKIQFAEMEHDFGQAMSGEDLTTTFGFKNVGDDVLVIEKVKGG